MSQRKQFIGKNFVLSVEDANGDFVEIAPLRTTKAKPIICSPIPGRGCIEYVPDWFGITHFG